jgi:hypothetical protein
MDKPIGAPVEPGNLLALKHGALSDALVMPGEELERFLYEEYPHLTGADQLAVRDTPSARSAPGASLPTSSESVSSTRSSGHGPRSSTCGAGSRRPSAHEPASDSIRSPVPRLPSTR